VVSIVFGSFQYCLDISGLKVVIRLKKIDFWVFKKIDQASVTQVAAKWV